MQQMNFINNGTGRPRPKAGYRCKICGKEGGLPDSHWYQLCPFKGDKRTFNPPRKGYMCKFCHKAGGEVDSHWFQQCPKRHEFEGVQVPHPLKLRTNPGMMNFLPQMQTTTMMNLNLLSQQNQMDYTQQFTNQMGFLMYPNQQPQISQQQQIYFLQQQLQNQNASHHFNQGFDRSYSDHDALLNEITKQTQELSFDKEPVSQNPVNLDSSHEDN